MDRLVCECGEVELSESSDLTVLAVDWQSYLVLHTLSACEDQFKLDELATD